ncbi:MAG TPA: AarF/UbiB family protein [Acidimicrobiia bacterium]|nr:AarF/UbiB family protein [Acidimicrobiia bacterium]
MIFAAEDLGDLLDLAVLLSLPGVLVLAWLVGRLLGVRRSWTTTLLSGLIGWIGGVALSLAIASQRKDPDTGFTRNVWLFSTLGVMSASVWIELLAKPGTLARAQTGLTSIPHPIKALKRRGRRVSRYAQITRIAIRNGLGPSLGLGRHSQDGEARQVPFARRLRHSLEECGGMFVKMGQVASTRSDLVSPPVAEELSHLQDHVAPAAPDDVRELLEDELDAPVEEVFAEFDWTPLAAASIGQAHCARLHGGQRVIVKVQRPGVADSVNRDLDVLDELATMVEQRTTWGAEYRVSDLADEFSERLREELDFEIEARNASDIAANLDGESKVRIPSVFHDLTTRRVLVMEWLDGVSVRETEEIDELGFDRRELAEALLRCMMQQMLVDAQYHADPHPGNVMVLRDGSLGLIDFGAASRIDPLQQTAIREVMIGVSQRDADLLRQAVLQVATLRRDVDDEELERALSRFMTRHLAPGMVPSAAMFNDLLQLFFTFGINLPPELSTFFRALITLEGTLTTLSPGYNVIDRAEAIAGEWMRARLAPSTLEELAREELVRMGPTLRRLPRRLDRMANQIERGNFRAKVSLFSDEHDERLVTKLVNRTVLALVGGVVGVIGVMLLGVRGGPPFAGDTSLYEFFGYFSLFCSVVLIMRVIVSVLHDGVN